MHIFAGYNQNMSTKSSSSSIDPGTKAFIKYSTGVVSVEGSKTCVMLNIIVELEMLIQNKQFKLYEPKEVINKYIG